MDAAIGQAMDKVEDSGVPILGFMIRQALEADEVASYLEMVAGHVRDGNLLGFQLNWHAGSEAIEANIFPKTPAKFISMDFKVEGERGKVRRTRR